VIVARPRRGDARGVKRVLRRVCGDRFKYLGVAPDAAVDRVG